MVRPVTTFRCVAAVAAGAVAAAAAADGLGSTIRFHNLMSDFVFKHHVSICCKIQQESATYENGPWLLFFCFSSTEGCLAHLITSQTDFKQSVH